MEASLQKRAPDESAEGHQVGQGPSLLHLLVDEHGSIQVSNLLKCTAVTHSTTHIQRVCGYYGAAPVHPVARDGMHSTQSAD